MKQLVMTLAPPPKAAIIDVRWLNMSDIAAGVGFNMQVLVSLALSDVLEPSSTEADGDYDQRLYDALWLARFQLVREQVSAATFNFTFPRRHWMSEELTEASLRLRAETREQAIFIGLLEDF